MRPIAAAFLPLTLGVISGVPADRPGTQVLDMVARRAEQVGCDAWRTLLGGCHRPARTEFSTSVRRLSLAAGIFVGEHWSNGVCSGHRDRITRYQCELETAFSDGDGAGFAEAFARYDDALARAVLIGGAVGAVDLATDTQICLTNAGRPAAEHPGRPAAEHPGRPTAEHPGRPTAEHPGRPTAEHPGRPTAESLRASGTMAEWARQARAASTRVTHRAVSPLRWATRRHATSSSRWSRHSRSAG